MGSRGAGEEAVLGLAAGFECWDFSGSSVVPEEELLGGGGIVAGVEVGEERGMLEAARAEVEDEIDERVELTLGERDVDEVVDGLFGVAEITLKDGAGLLRCYAVGVALGVDEAVAIADGGKTGDVEIGVGAKSFRVFDELKTCSAELHGDTPRDLRARVTQAGKAFPSGAKAPLILGRVRHG